MPPRCSDELKAAAAPAGDPFATLPHALALALFALLPVDQRMRCAEVCRGWRAMLSDVSLWLRLDLSPASGVARATDALLRAAAARAAGCLQALDVSGFGRITYDSIHAVAAENVGALVELRMATPHDDAKWRVAAVVQLEALLQAAPLLRVLEADGHCGGVNEARCLLRNEAPFGPLRVHVLHAYGLEDAAEVRIVAEHAAAHASLNGLDVNYAPLNEPAALDAVVDMAVQRCLTYVALDHCGLSPASVPALARLCGGSGLRALRICCSGERLLDEPAAVLLGNALRANTTLTSVTFRFMGIFSNDAAAAALLGALTAHPGLQKLDISANLNAGGATPVLPAAGAALAALVAANAPALHELNLEYCALGDATLGPLVDALPVNTHLRSLECRHTRLSEAFVRDRLRPALRGSPWLEALYEAQ
jgi:hypothetical protein